MKIGEYKKLIETIFAPKKDEKIIIIVDEPHDHIKDNKNWRDLRKFAEKWYYSLKTISQKIGFTVELKYYKATGLNNAPISRELIKELKKYNLIMAINNYSATTSLLPLCKTKELNCRCASMPGIEKRMEKTVFKADYNKIKIYADKIKDLLNNSQGAEIRFSTGDKLFIDLRNRNAFSENGECKFSGQFINFPSGEGFIAPYEAVYNEKQKFGKSKTKGIVPIRPEEKIIKLVVENNKIRKIKGEKKQVEYFKRFFEKNETRGNIAELGIGCNPYAQVTGNIIEDEKAGLHLAYGTSAHIGGRIQSDVHQDICFSKNCPIEGTKLSLYLHDGEIIELINNSLLKYDLLK
jgi:leucyl aminopeptidase (aminopeptidase T)